MSSTLAWSRPLAAVIAAALLTLALAPHASGQQAGIKVPAPAGTQWEVLAGYNTVTHTDIDPYALDLWRVDGETGGTPLLAPMSGEIGYVSDDCVAVRTSEVNLLICHVLPTPGLERGDPVALGQPLGTIAPDGLANNAGIAHLHLQLNVRNGDWGSSGESLPFSGPYALEGRSFEATTEQNAYFGELVVSSNGDGTTPVAFAPPTVQAGDDRTVEPGEIVTLSASATDATRVTWTQAEGPSIIVDPYDGASLTFAAPQEASVLRFTVTATGGGGTGTDEVVLTVVGAASTPPPPPPPQQQPQVSDQPGQIVSGEVFAGGVSLVVFGGGTNEELVAAAACPLPTVSFWATGLGEGFTGYNPNVPAFVNERWDILFPEGIPALTPLIVRCG